MPIPTEPIGSIPRPSELIAAFHDKISSDEFAAIAERALRDTIRRFEETGSPVLTDGEQTKPSFATYPIAGLPNLASDGVVIPFADGQAFARAIPGAVLIAYPNVGHVPMEQIPARSANDLDRWLRTKVWPAPAGAIDAGPVAPAG